MSGIKILIVDESMLFRGMCARELDKLLPPGHDIIKVGDAHEALRKINDGEPNGILVNTQLSGMSGFDFISEVKGRFKSKIVAISINENDRNRAISLGADEFIIKPMGMSASRNEFLQMLCQRVVDLSKGTNARSSIQIPKGDWCKLIAIGSSTGGTEALSEVLSNLKAPMPPILVVQHISPTFSKLFAARLDTECSMKVKEAENGERARSDTIYIAPGDKHMSISVSMGIITIHCQAGERIHGVTTSVDVLFESVAKYMGNKALGVILTGMGVDGASKLLEMRKAGAKTLGQDEASCVVYGMPKAAFNLGAVEKQVSLSKMAGEITALVHNS
ncbi:MAG: response regulator [Anaerovibrio sp.]|uniref:chemotaxis protein CheB n=1 Tax=Anaerovibrio sp. TaxID=1872532 RepID=UPI002600AE06|nr:chemotaxis protein CheB [Anaerovibrio sp.]MCR5175725.1 response regulator [Anaerovibrio sp.]